MGNFSYNNPRGTFDDDNYAVLDKMSDGTKLLIATIFPEISYEGRLLYTESNIINMLYVHEYKGHLLDGYGEDMHWQILKDQKADRSWETTTPEFKDYYNWLEQQKYEYQQHNEK